MHYYPIPTPRKRNPWPFSFRYLRNLHTNSHMLDGVPDYNPKTAAHYNYLFTAIQENRWFIVPV